MMDNASLIEDLASCPLFASLKKNHLEALFSRSRRSRMTLGQRIYRTGTINEHVHVVRDGTLLRAFVHDGGTIPFANLSTGQCWGHGNIAVPARTYPYDVLIGSKSAQVISIRIYDLLVFLKENREQKIVLTNNILKIQSDEQRETEQALGLLLNTHMMARSRHDDALRIERILAALTVFFGVQHAVLARFDRTANTILIEKSHNFSPDLTGRSFPLSSDTVFLKVLTTEKPMIVDATSFERQFTLSPYARPLMAIVPLFEGEHVMGALMIGDEDSELSVTHEAIQMLGFVGTLIAGILNHSARKKEGKDREFLKRSYIGSFDRLI